MTVRKAEVSKKNLPCTFHSLKVPAVFAQVVQQFTRCWALFLAAATFAAGWLGLAFSAFSALSVVVFFMG
jgi:hypothetical protein